MQNSKSQNKGAKTGTTQLYPAREVTLQSDDLSVHLSGFRNQVTVGCFQQAFYNRSLSEHVLHTACSGQQRHHNSQPPIYWNSMPLQLWFSVGDYSFAHSIHTGSSNENHLIYEVSECNTSITMMSQTSSPLISS